ncbi:RNA polymerase sigma factor [Piscinibacterium candidicorallinum]|uniref:RNA polymerase sigma factor n=1 Tax=Piscinibacterium candidicorallinum TaxID=1793872 RepID=A0ABV7H7N8_9BURK
MIEDRAMVQAVLAGVPGAFEQLVRAHQRLTWHILARMVRDPEDARELAQETFLRVHAQLHQFRFESALKTWIGRVAYSIALRHLEKKRLNLVSLDIEPVEGAAPAWEPADPAVDVEALWADAQLRERLYSAIETLPELPRTLLTLYHLDELSIAEIAQITGLATGTIKSHLFRARARLREQLGDLASPARAGQTTNAARF